jgi:hypothetical protein
MWKCSFYAFESNRSGLPQDLFYDCLLQPKKYAEDYFLVIKNFHQDSDKSVRALSGKVRENEWKN